MVDNNPDFITKADLQVLLASVQQDFATKLDTERAEFKKELDIQANKIHSSYVKKLKATEPEGDETPKGKASKRELELEEIVRKNSETMVEFLKREQEKDAEVTAAKSEVVLANHKNNFTETLIKKGFSPTAVESIFKLQQFDKNFVEDGKGGFNWKVKHQGLEVALPIAQAAEYFVKSEVAEQFLPGRTNGGGTKPSNPTFSKDGGDKGSNRRIPTVNVDWANVINDMHGGSSEGDGTFAPPFDSSK